MSQQKDRKLQVTLPPLYKRMVEAQSDYSGETMSGICVTAIKKYYETMPEGDKKRILDHLAKQK